MLQRDEASERDGLVVQHFVASSPSHERLAVGVVSLGSAHIGQSLGVAFDERIADRLRVVPSGNVVMA